MNECIEITVILPIRNEEKYIENTINSILAQTYPLNKIEIIVADGMSDDTTLDIIRSLTSEKLKIHIIGNSDKIVSVGFNRALSAAKGNIIIRIDGHCVIADNYFETCVKLLDSIDADCVGGATKHQPSDLVSDLISFAQCSKFGVGGVSFREGVSAGKFVDTLAFGAYRKEVFLKIGGYDEELIRNQDDEFNYRLIQSGGKIWIDPSVSSTYYPRNSLVKLFKQYFQYGVYKIRVFQKRRGIASVRHLIPVLFISSLLASSTLFLILNIPIALYIFVVILLSYSFVNLFASFFGISRFIKKGNLFNTNHYYLKVIFLFPPVFSIFHVSYGLGMLIGIVKFRKLWLDNKLLDSHFSNIRN